MIVIILFCFKCVCFIVFNLVVFQCYLPIEYCCLHYLLNFFIVSFIKCLHLFIECVKPICIIFAFMVSKSQNIVLTRGSAIANGPHVCGTY